MKYIVTIALLALGVGAFASECSCVMPSSCLENYESETTPLIKAKAMKTLEVPNSEYTYTLFEYNFVFRGCPPSHHEFVVKTPSTTAACGVAFEEGTKYLLTLRLSTESTPPPAVAAYNRDLYSAVSCNFNKKWAEVPYGDANTLYYSEIRGCEA